MKTSLRIASVGLLTCVAIVSCRKPAQDDQHVSHSSIQTAGEATTMSQVHERNPNRSDKVRCHLDLMLNNGEVWANLSFKNDGMADVRLLKRNLFAGNTLDWDAFQVVRDGATVPYQGIAEKHPAPKDSDYFTLSPGAKQTSKVPAGRSYDMKGAGKYVVQFSTMEFQKDGAMVSIDSNSAQIIVP